MSWTLVYKRFKIGPEFFYPASVNSAFFFIARLQNDGDQQTELNQTLPTTVRFSATSRLNGEYLLNEAHIDNRARASENTRGPLLRSKTSWTLVHKWHNRTSFYPRSIFCYVPSPSHTYIINGINMAPTANQNETAFGLFAAQIRSPNKILTRQWHHVGRP